MLNSKTKVWVLVGAIIAVVIAAVIAVVFYQVKSQSINVPAIINQGNQLDQQGKHQEAIDLINQNLPKAHTNSDRYQLYDALGSYYFNAGNDAKAVEAWEQANQADPTKLDAVENVATTAEQMGDKQTAVEYYQKAIDLLKNYNDQGSKDLIGQYQQKIKDLGGGQ